MKSGSLPRTPWAVGPPFPSGSRGGRNPESDPQVHSGESGCPPSLRCSHPTAAGFLDLPHWACLSNELNEGANSGGTSVSLTLTVPLLNKVTFNILQSPLSSNTDAATPLTISREPLQNLKTYNVNGKKKIPDGHLVLSFTRLKRSFPWFHQIPKQPALVYILVPWYLNNTVQFGEKPRVSYHVY